LIGDAAKAKEQLGWQPTVGFTELIEMMVDSDLAKERAANRQA
jgi:GDPmannose 4,6-dehydratase